MVLATAVKADKPRSELAKRAAWAHAALLVVMAVGQLFAFEKFLPLISSYWLPGGAGTAALLAGVTVISEVFALPYLLRMPLSPLMRVLGVVCSFIVPILWIVLSMVALTSTYTIDNGGIFGTKVSVSVTAQLILSVFLLGLAAWSWWGLRSRSKK